MSNVIEQIVQPGKFGSQTIEMVVRSNERGPQGIQGEPGDAATVTAGNAYTIDYGKQPVVMNSGTPNNAILDFYLPEGRPGAIHYTAGPGINITPDNRIEATGEAAVYWGDLVGSMSNQTDLKNALDAKQNKLTAGSNITISGSTISATNTTYTAGSNITITGTTISATNTTYNDFTGTDGVSAGTAGLVPAPTTSDGGKVLKGDGTWGMLTSDALDKLSLLNLFYPVGSYYETSNPLFNPNTSWGGTWVEDSAGRVTVAKDSGTFTTIGSTGGEETHTLTINEIPSHTHKLGFGQGNNSAGDPGVLGTDSNSTPDTSATGGGQAHNNLQPYVVVRRWHRTA